MNMKECTKCKLTKPVIEFKQISKYNSALKARCIECEKFYLKEKNRKYKVEHTK